MAARSSAYRFGDLLALARQSWVNEMTRRLAGLGYPGYRRSDAGALRVLQYGPVPVGRLGTYLGVTRQAARKAADGLQRRGYATTGRDQRDARQVNVTLTPAGHDYARAVVAVIDELNRQVGQQADPAQLAAADAVLRSVLFDDSARQRAERLPRPAGPGVPPAIATGDEAREP
jgi:DNA-binding MarR family transcriptional regulator